MAQPPFGWSALLPGCQRWRTSPAGKLGKRRNWHCSAKHTKSAKSIREIASRLRTDTNARAASLRMTDNAPTFDVMHTQKIQIGDWHYVSDVRKQKCWWVERQDVYLKSCYSLLPRSDTRLVYEVEELSVEIDVHPLVAHREGKGNSWVGFRHPLAAPCKQIKNNTY